MKKRILSVVLAFCMMLTMLPVQALAAETASGVCGANGDNLTWSYSNGTLSIKGTGHMADYDSETSVPWYNYRSQIRTVIIETGVANIGACAFYGGNAGYPYVTSVSIPDTVTSIGEHAFHNCTRLTTISIPDSVDTIGEGAFMQCSSLARANIPASVTRIESHTFYNCIYLNLSIPNSITSIGDHAFQYCRSLDSTIPDSVIEFGYEAFGGCDKLTYVSISANTIIDSVAFASCRTLSAIDVADDNPYYSSVDGVLFNKDQTRLITYPAGRKEKYYTIPSSVTTLGFEAFSGCTYLAHVTIPGSVKSFGGSNIFENCSNLIEVVIHKGLSSLTLNMFRNCSKLERITVPVSVTSIHQFAFEGCDSLTDVYYGGTESQWQNIEDDGANDPLFNANIHYNSTPITSFTVTFNANSGTGTMTAQTFTSGEAQNLKTNTFTRSGYHFTGWNSQSDGNGTSYSDGQSITLNEDLTLYAQWAAAQTYTVTFLANGGNPNTSTKTVVTGQSYGELPTTVYRAGGKYFDGWYTAENGGVQIFESTIVNLTGDQTLYAHWGDLPSVIPPVVFTREAANVERSSAVFNAELFDDGGDSNLTLEFVYWNKLEADTRYSVSAAASGKSFSATVRNLSPGTTYYYYAKATNSAGEGVGSAVSLTTKPEETPVSISVEPTYLSLETGNTYQLLATVLPATAANRAVSWSSSDSSTVSVDANGTITAKKSGKGIVITATTVANGLTAACTIDVSAPEPEIKGAFDFSELNMASNTGNYAGDGIGFNSLQGGNSQKATAYLARWDGAVLEANDPYPAYDGNHSAHYKEVPSDYHVQNIYWLPKRQNLTDNDEIKAAVMKYGAVYESFYVDNVYFDNSSTNYYCPIKLKDGGHAVAVVGWDDNYPASNFTNTPPGNGAFICRNSWGANSGEGGYFYISYYDMTFSIDEGGMVIPSVEKNTNYNKIYQYDPLGACGSLYYENATSIYTANVFPEKGNTLQSDEKLSAVSFYTYSKNTSYEIYIVTDYQTKTDLQNKGAAVASGTQNDMGYHTVMLKNPISLKKGTRFAVIVKLSVGSGDIHVYFEYPYANYSSNAKANADEGYYSHNAISWTDLTNEFKNANFCIKAFTDDGGNRAQLMEAIDNDERSYESDKVYTLDEVLDLGIMINKKYVEWEQRVSLMNQVDGQLGLIPVIIGWGDNDVSFIDGAILPTKYDLREQGCVTEIRDQGDWGHCWTFASYASLESCLLKKAKTISSDFISAGANFWDILATVGQSGISVTKLTMSEQSLTLSEGDSRRVTVTFEPVSATNSALHWSSDDENVATVDTNGTITGRSAGQTKITARTENGVTASCTVTVSGTGVSIDSVTLNSGTASAEVTCDIAKANVYCAGYTTNGQLVTTSIQPVHTETQKYDFKMSDSVQYVKVFVLGENLAPLCPEKRSGE